MDPWRYETLPDRGRGRRETLATVTMFSRKRPKVTMQPVTHQTIKLSGGRHCSPDDGACVMELASMLAGERFSDHPSSVCPVIAALLRLYNDVLDDERRQDLYAYAAKVVGSRAGGEVRRARVHHVKLWISEHARRKPYWFSLCRLRAVRHGTLDALAVDAIRALPAGTGDSHEAMLALIDQLLSISGQAAPDDLHVTGDVDVAEPAGR